METAIFERLDGPLRALAGAESAGDVLGHLLTAAPSCVPRAALFVVRGDQAVGWASTGYPDDLAARQRGVSISLDQSWLGELAEIGFDLRTATGLGSEPDFGQSEASESVGATIVVEGRPIALVIGERQSDEAWEPRALGWLATVAGLRLELALTRKRLVASPPAPAVAEAKPSTYPTPASETTPDSPSEPAHAPTTEATGLAEVADDGPTGDPRLEAARRYARLVATDIRLYNEDAVVLGRRHRDLAERLSDPMTMGRQSFLERHGELGSVATSILREAYLEVLAGGDAALLPDTLFET